MVVRSIVVYALNGTLVLLLATVVTAAVSCSSSSTSSANAIKLRAELRAQQAGQSTNSDPGPRAVAYPSVKDAAGGAGAGAGVGGGRAKAGQGAPAVHPFQIFETTWPDSAVRGFYNDHGIERIALYTQWYCCPRTEEGDFWFDESWFRVRLHTPTRPAERCGCQTDRISGIPPTWKSWVIIDLERPIWTAIMECDADEAERAKSADVFFKVIDAVRSARPGVKLAVYGLPFHDDGPCAALEREILERVEGTVPAFYMVSTRSNERALHDQRLRRHLAYKNSREDFKVFPIVWKKWKDIEWPEGSGSDNSALIPEAIARPHIQWILDYEVEGTQVDGMIIFDAPKSRDPATDVDFARIIVEEVAARSPDPAEAR